MNPKHTSPEQNKIPEQLPSREEVRSAFETILQGREYKELRTRNDKTGLCLYEIEVTLENNDKVEYNYQKDVYSEPSFPGNTKNFISIHKITYDPDGTPYGKSVANYINGKWEYFS